ELTSISLENRIAAEALGAATFVHITTLAVLVDALHPISQLPLDAVKVGDQRGNSPSGFSRAWSHASVVVVLHVAICECGARSRRDRAASPAAVVGILAVD